MMRSRSTSAISSTSEPSGHSEAAVIPEVLRQQGVS
jgi:hypothetical protein